MSMDALGAALLRFAQECKHCGLEHQPIVVLSEGDWLKLAKEAAAQVDPGRDVSKDGILKLNGVVIVRPSAFG